jgi:hypothetical protein
MLTCVWHRPEPILDGADEDDCDDNDDHYERDKEDDTTNVLKIKVNRTIHILIIYIHRSLFDFWIVLFYLFNGASYKSPKKQPQRLRSPHVYPISRSDHRLLRGISTFHHLEIVGLGLETSEHPSEHPSDAPFSSAFPEKKHMDSIWYLVGGLCGAITCFNQLEQYESMGFG